MNWTNDAVNEVVKHVSKESNVLSRESFKSMESMNSTIGAQSANSIAAVAREFGGFELVDNNNSIKTNDSVTKLASKNALSQELQAQVEPDVQFVPGVGPFIGSAVAAVAAAVELIAATQDKGRESNASSIELAAGMNSDLQSAKRIDNFFQKDRSEKTPEDAMKTNSNSGINSLIAVTQLKNSNANEQALSHADDYAGFSDVVRDDSNIWEAEYVPLAEDYSDKYSESAAEPSPYFQSWSGIGNASEVFDVPVATRKNKIGSSFNWNKADNYTNYAKVDTFKPITADWWQNNSDDKLDSFSIQQLMSDYNQAETLASSVTKKSDDTKSSVIGKI